MEDVQDVKAVYVRLLMPVGMEPTALTEEIVNNTGAVGAAVSSAGDLLCEGYRLITGGL